jgi:hypothetical protein
LVRYGYLEKEDDRYRIPDPVVKQAVMQ